LGATYDDHLRLVGKGIVDFLLVLIELFSLCRTAEALRTKIDRKSAISPQRGHVDPKFQVEGDVPHQQISKFSLDLIYCWCGAAARAGRFDTFSSQFLGGRNFVARFSVFGEPTTSNFGSIYVGK